MEDVRFDDIEALRAKIQDGFGAWSAPIEVTQEMINRFADVTGDHQWIHLDVERAKRESPFGTTIAHGFLTLSLVPKLSTGGSWRVTGFGNATNYGAEKLRFVSPVPAGSSVHARSRLLAAEAKPKGTQLTQEIHIHVVGNDRPALTYEMLTLYHPKVQR
jgi:acyl dehydratase